MLPLAVCLYNVLTISDDNIHLVIGLLLYPVLQYVQRVLM